MPKEQILVCLNPDVLPSGSDLAVCNAARRSFGKRSDWDYICKCGIKQDRSKGYEHWSGCGADVTDCNATRKVRQLKESDKRLLHFLARGMTTDDFSLFKEGLIDAIEHRDFGLYCDLFGADAKSTDMLDAGLTEMLWKWRNTPAHDTPFNHCHISFEVKAPIFVARQLVKTEYAPFSEFSRRYITDDVEFYVHDYRVAVKDKKQGSGGLHVDNAYWQKEAARENLRQLDLYNSMITSGVAPEQARGVLPTDLMTSWTWSATLGAFAKMCRERLGSDAQKETRYVAEQVYSYLKEYYPVSAKSLVEGV